MAQTVAVVRATLTATLSGTTDFTKTGFGTPTAAIVICCNAYTAGNPTTNVLYSIGFWDGTNQSVVSNSASDGAGTTNTYKDSDDSYILTLQGAGAYSCEYQASAVTDGIRLTMTTDNTSATRYATVILLKGVSAKLVTLATNTTQNATAESASLGFAPKLVFFTSIGATSADTTLSNTSALLSFGFARDDATHRMVAFGSAAGQGTDQATLLYSETRCVGEVTGDATVWTGEVTTFGADTFTITTRDGSSGADVVFALALGGADLSFDCGTLTTPTSTGDSVVSTDVSPDALIIMASTATGTTLHTDSGANGWMIGFADDDGEFSHTAQVEDAADITNCNSVASATAVMNLDSSSGGTRTDMCDATVTLNSADFTLNYTATDGTARKGWWVAFGGTTVAPVAVVTEVMPFWAE